jgi:hypothetical protein
MHSRPRAASIFRGERSRAGEIAREIAVHGGAIRHLLHRNSACFDLRSSDFDWHNFLFELR